MLPSRASPLLSRLRRRFSLISHSSGRPPQSRSSPFNHLLLRLFAGRGDAAPAPRIRVSWSRGLTETGRVGDHTGSAPSPPRSSTKHAGAAGESLDMGNSGVDIVGSKAAQAKGVAAVAAVEGTGSVRVSVGRGKGDAVAAVGRGNMLTPIGRSSTAPSIGRGNMAASIGRGNTTASSDHAAESPTVGGSGDVPVVGSVSGFAAGVAGDHLASRGPEVQLPVPNPAIGLAGDINNIWCHGKPISGNGWTCGYCGVSRHGGGATRFKDHLAGLSGNCHSCLNVPHHVARVFREIIPKGKVTRRKKKEVKIRVQEEVDRGNNIRTSINICDEADDDLDATMQRTMQAHIEGNSNEAGCSNVRANSAAGQTNLMKGYFDRELAYAKTRPQQTLEVCIKKVEYAGRLGKAWSKWFHANDIPGHKTNCPYFIGALKLTQDLGKGVAAPKGSEIDGIYLQSNYEELQQYVSKFKDDWAAYGVTLMTDSWTGPTQMSIINFMVFSNGRMYFHKSVNATGNIQNSQFVYEHIIEVIVNEIGLQHVVQLVTDNGPNFKKACLDLVGEYPHISWQPCAAHTINLMLKDIGCFAEIDAVVRRAKRICRFFYNHSTLHAEMHNKIGGELVRPNATRFGTVFMFLQSLWDKQEHFKVWMTSPEWRNSSWSSEAHYDYTYDCLTNRKWWENVKWVLDVVRPLYIVLRYADS